MWQTRQKRVTAKLDADPTQSWQFADKKLSHHLMVTSLGGQVPGHGHGPHATRGILEGT